MNQLITEQSNYYEPESTITVAFYLKKYGYKALAKDAWSGLNMDRITDYVTIVRDEALKRQDVETLDNLYFSNLISGAEFYMLKGVN